MVDPKNLCTVFVSPRQRAHKTFHLLFSHVPELPHHILTEEAREWDYGNFSVYWTSFQAKEVFQVNMKASCRPKSKRKILAGPSGKMGR